MLPSDIWSLVIWRQRGRVKGRNMSRQVVIITSQRAGVKQSVSDTWLVASCYVDAALQINAELMCVQV